MRTLWIRVAIFIIAAAFIVGLGANRAVLAQDAMSAKVTCDSDLILSLYTAENNFDFAAVEDKLMAADTTGMMAKLDLASYDKGQFAPLFDAMMSMMDSSMSTGHMSDQVMSGVVSAMGMDQAALDQAMMSMTPEASAMGEMTPEATDAMMEAMTPEATAAMMEEMTPEAAMMTELVPASVAGEPAECTALRTELRHFYTALAYSSMMTPHNG